MRIRRTSLLLGLVLLFCAVSFAFSSIALLRSTEPESTLERVLRTGILRVGAPADYAPFALARCEGTGVVGSDIDESASLAESLGSSLSVVRVPWSELTLDNRETRFDLAVGGIDDTLLRRRRVDFSIVRRHPSLSNDSSVHTCTSARFHPHMTTYET